jgi:hypothetical protein
MLIHFPLSSQLSKWLPEDFDGCENFPYNQAADIPAHPSR